MDCSEVCMEVCARTVRLELILELNGVMSGRRVGPDPRPLYYLKLDLDHDYHDRMPQFEDFSAWVTIDGTPAAEYQTSVNGRRVTCYIASEVGKVRCSLPGLGLYFTSPGIQNLLVRCRRTHADTRNSIHRRALLPAALYREHAPE